MAGNVAWEPGYELVRQVSAAQRRRAILIVAAHATDAADLAELLAMLGLAARDVRPDPVDDEPGQPRSGPPPELLAELAAFAARMREEADERGQR